MSSLIELVEKVRAGQPVDDAAFDAFADSPNQAERFLANYARASQSLKQGRDLLFEALRAVDFADPLVLKQFLDVSNYVGQRERNAWAIYRYGKAITARDWPAALGAIQDAIRVDQTSGGAMTSQREMWTDIAGEYEKAAKMLAKRPAAKRRSGDGSEKRLNVAFLTSCVVDDSAQAQLLSAMARHVEPARYSLRVYVTDAPAREPSTDFASYTAAEPSYERGARTIELLHSRSIECWTLPGGIDVARQARMLVERAQCDGVDVLFVDASLADAAAWIAVANRAAPIQTALVRRRPVGVAGVDQVVWLDEARRESDQSFWQQLSIPTTSIRQGIDTDLRAAPADRTSCGVPVDAVILTTHTGRPQQTLTRSFVDAIVQVLIGNPQAVYLVSGEGDFGVAKQLFETAGMGKRVGFAGARRDLQSFLRMADIYVAEFPVSDRAGVMQAAALARPIVTMASRDVTSDFRHLPELAQVVGGSTSAYVARVNQLVRDASLRAQLGQQMRSFAAERFSLSRTVNDLLNLAAHLDIQRERAAAAATPQRKVA